MGLECVGLIGKDGILICKLILLARVCFNARLGLCFGEGKILRDEITNYIICHDSIARTDLKTIKEKRYSAMIALRVTALLPWWRL